MSVLTPSYGYGRFIEDAVLSVMGQEGPTVQHVVQDACSPDGTVDVLKRYGHAVDWVSEPDDGQSDALNKALDRARGRWIAWLNADEFFLPGSLAALVAHAEKTKADVVYGDCAFVAADGRLERLVPQHSFSRRILREYGCFISSVSTLFRRSMLGDSPWDPDIKRIMDWDLYMKLTSRGARFSHLKYPVGAFRRHDESITAVPPDDFNESTAVSLRYGLPEDVLERWKAARWGRTLHPIYKLWSGGYIRQHRAVAVHGKDLRWFHRDAARQSFEALVQRCYRGSERYVG